ncbi:MAG: YbaB/EbfC family nucleoid-associated protein [Roseovarius sp.]|nr:YbaB/EbfC family nucleoid-associated protein [Roseovarius sp.]MCY4208632.1 YbaB/EbfC family nucleoid-associated protein [Roseovarius sp.]MCY4291291.1 YbaB/EbfC family nucleoid-associated protein [Roseovarius sp.]MCY4315387.1 YbaB/EbfC family nucleoid-associated protein [Roseovarius sp.]
MFKGLGQLGDMKKMMMAAEQMQQKMQAFQEEMKVKTVEGASGAGLVKVTCTLKGELKSLEIDPSILNPNDRETVEDLILAAANNAQSLADETSKREVAKIAESMGLPKGMDLPI